MKIKLLLIALMGTFLFTSCGFWGVRGSGKVVEEKRKIGEFESLEASGAFTIKVKVGESPSIKIYAENNLLKFINTHVKGNTLIIDTKKNISPRKEIKILITTPMLTSISCSGANSITAENINCDDFDVDLSGAGNIDLFGKVGNLRAEISGAGNIDAKDLIANDVVISVSGAASADVYSKEYLDASVSGVGSIDYYGNPKKTNTNVSGVGSISRK
jgi:hypothetical protein